VGTQRQRDHQDVCLHLARMPAPGHVRRRQGPRDRAPPGHRHPLAADPLRDHHSRRRAQDNRPGLRPRRAHRPDRGGPRRQARNLSARAPARAPRQADRRSCGRPPCQDEHMGIVLAIWFFVASAWLMIGTRRQVELSWDRVRRQERLAAETYTAVKEWTSEVPRWRPWRRRQLRREIEEIVRDDAGLWTRYQEIQKDLSAWNLLESAAALASAAALYQLFEAVRVMF